MCTTSSSTRAHRKPDLNGLPLRLVRRWPALTLATPVVMAAIDQGRKKKEAEERREHQGRQGGERAAAMKLAWKRVNLAGMEQYLGSDECTE